jgi:hypothetical protein
VLEFSIRSWILLRVVTTAKISSGLGETTFHSIPPKLPLLTSTAEVFGR